MEEKLTTRSEMSNPRDDYFAELAQESGQDVPVLTLSRPAKRMAVLDAPAPRIAAGPRKEKAAITSETPKKRSTRFGWLSACFLFALGCFWIAAPSMPPSELSAIVAQPEREAETPPAPEKRLITKNIEDVRLGDRVLGENPQGPEEHGAEPDPATWRHLSLRMVKGSGHTLDIELLRPLDWIDQHGAMAGQTIHLDLVELGASGPAKVLSIAACPPIKEGTGQVVTGLFSHDPDVGLVDVRFEESGEPIGGTSNRPYWSEDRQEFVEAGDLKPGETVRSQKYGVAHVASVTARPNRERVYNLEVQGEHVYEVGELGVLVHNVYGVPPEDLSSLGRALRKIEGVQSVEAFGSRAGSTFRGRGPLPTSDLDIFVTVDSAVVNSAAARAKITEKINEVADLFTRSKGITVEPVVEIDVLADIIKAGIKQTPFIPF